MSLFDEIARFRPLCEQEERDQAQMLAFMQANPDHLLRTNLVGHVTTSIWTVDPTHTKTLMVYHNVYDSWSWIGGHADGQSDLRSVAMRELREETGVLGARLVSDEMLSLETLTVNGHFKRGVYVPCHLHFNVTFLAEASEDSPLAANPDENQAVRWFGLEDALAASAEPWMVANVYRKLVERSRR